MSAAPMRLTEFKRRVRQAFGERLEHATPANVREFLDQLQQETWQSQRAEHRAREGHTDVPIELPSNTGSITWESLVRDFFLQTLEMDQEQAVMMLWIFGLDLAYSGIEELNSDSFNRLFRDISG
jgi:hypothetical protein